MNITVNQIFFKPVIEFEVVDIFGLRYPQRVSSPNLYVVGTEDEITNGSNVEFKYNKLFYTLEDVNVVKSDGKVFIECRYWSEEMF